MMKTLIYLLALLSFAALGLDSGIQLKADDNWHQPAGPNGNWQVDGTPPVQWSVTRNENIRWRTPMPEAGMSGVTVWGDRVFVTTHVPIKTLQEKESVTDIIGFCLDANTGKTYDERDHLHRSQQQRHIE